MTTNNRRKHTRDGGRPRAPYFLVGVGVGVGGAMLFARVPALWGFAFGVLTALMAVGVAVWSLRKIPTVSLAQAREQAQAPLSQEPVTAPAAANDVTDALIKLGMPRAVAAKVVARVVMEQGPGAGFEELFKRAMVLRKVV